MGNEGAGLERHEEVTGRLRSESRATCLTLSETDQTQDGLLQPASLVAAIV